MTLAALRPGGVIMKLLNFLGMVIVLTAGSARADQALDTWQAIRGLIQAKTGLEANTPPASLDEVNHVEKLFGIKIPNDFRNFILQACNGARLSSDIGTPELPYISLLPVSEWGMYLEQYDESYRTWLLQEMTKDVGESLGFLAADLDQHSITLQQHGAPIVIIGVGAIDYDQEVLLNLRTGHIYTFTHNIPIWKNHGTFTEWLNSTYATMQENLQWANDVFGPGIGTVPELIYWLPLPKPDLTKTR